MRIAMFGTKPYDRVHFEKANLAAKHDLVFLEPRLGAATAKLAEGAEAVCVFVNDEARADTIDALAAFGVRLIALRCAGFNNVDLEAAKRRGIAVVRVPAYSPHAVAEHALALILALNRKTHKAYNRVREGNFALDGLIGFDLFGKTVGVVGTGRIGAIVARILAGFGCKILAYDVRRDPDVEAGGAWYVPLERLLGESDIVSLHCPLSPATRHMIDAAALGRMKPRVMLINTSRGALIDTPAVLEALKSGRIGWLGLDVYEEEEGVFFEDLSQHVLQDDVLARLLTFPNVLITGHQAFLTEEALTNIAETTLDNVARCQRGEPCSNRVEPK